MSECEDIPVSVISKSDKAFRLANRSEGADALGSIEWFPQSEVILKQHNTKTGKAIANIPIWLLEKKGW